MTGRVKVEVFDADISTPIDSEKLAHHFLPENTTAGSFVPIELLSTAATSHPPTNGVQFSLPLSRLVDRFIFYSCKLKTPKIKVDKTYHLIAYGLPPILGESR